jgi:peptide/nickel transport system substrate-binding protein
MSSRGADIRALVLALEHGQISRRQFIQRGLAAGLSLSAASGLLAACGGGADEAGVTKAETGPAQRGGTITVAVSPPSYPIDAFESGDPGSRLTFQNVINYLVFITPDLRVEPELASEWTSNDARTWTVKLREGVKFHSGKDFTAEDVVATFERVIDPKSGSSGVSSFAGFLEKGGTTKIDDYTVQFDLTRPISGFPYVLRTYQAAILSADYDGDFAGKPDGTGPFALANYTPKQGAELVRNKNYWEPDAPLLDGFRLVYFEDVAAQVTALQSGEADIMMNVPLATIPTVQAGGEDIQLLSASSSSHLQLAMRVDEEPWDDKRVRQALAYSIDREQLVSQLLGGYADAGNDHLIAPVFPIATSVDIPQREQDYEKAKSLLAEAGHPDGVDVVLRTHPGFGLPDYAQAVVEMAKGAGFQIDLKVEPDEIYYEHWNTAPFALEAWIHRAWPSQLLNLAYRSGADWNVPHWSNDEFDGLVEEFDAALDEGEQARLAGEIATLMNDETPAIISYFIKTTKAVSTRVKGQKPEPTDFLDLRKTWVD